MSATVSSAAVAKLPTGIEGFDLLAFGGLPQGRATLLSGTAGSAKTVFACQFLADGILKAGESGVFVTFEETPDDIRRNLAGFGWPVAQWEKENRWAFVDGSPQVDAEPFVAGNYDLSALIHRVEYAARKTGAKRMVVDSIGGIFSQFADGVVVRHEIFRLIAALKKLGVTALVTAERLDDHGNLTRFGVEEFVADNVVILRNALDNERRRRTVEILKLRGTCHQKGEYPFTVTPDRGVIIVPLSAIELNQRSSETRMTTGNSELDRMCGGGFFRDSVILISGPTGTGKTLITTQYIAGGVANRDRCLLLAFEESRDQFFRNAAGWGMDLTAMEAKGLLRVACVYPESATLEDHLINLKRELAEFRPTRLAVDSLSALERGAGEKSFREFVISLTSLVKQMEIAGLFTATTASLLGGTSVTETHISSITDSIILLRYVELFGEMRRGITVLKMRGSAHDKEIREVTIDNRGMHVGQPFRNVSGILSGQFAHKEGSGEMDRIAGMFNQEEQRRDPTATERR